LPFVGGAVGYFGYDLCHHVEKLPRTAVDDVDIPDLYLCFYHGAIVIDHKEVCVYITDAELKPGGEERTHQIEVEIEKAQSNLDSIEVKDHLGQVEFKPNMDKETYLNGVRRIKEYIRTGDIYQANMTQRFETVLRHKPIELYKKLREINPAPFAAYLDFGNGQIVSSSPERFLKVRDGKIETRPIKGTLPRGKTPEEDEVLKVKLQNSMKDRSELLMIVDLERNDLSRVAKTGTVEVPELFVIESYATVHHLVSTVTAELGENKSIADLLEASFPGGSITGAPKIMAMKVIDELEPTQRGIYTGSIGYIDFNGNADLNIVIRTVVCKDDTAYFQVGGGIVWDSDEYLEYDETLDKARALMNALNY
jgi:para-aminobenzoate synthetase component 1